jgi:hypothetical protein
MTGALDDNLEQRLAGLTAWPGGKTQVWRRALKEAGTAAKATPGGLRRVLLRLTSWKVAACAAVFALLVTAVAVNSVHRLSKKTVAMCNERGSGQAFYVYAPDDPGTFPKPGGIKSETGHVARSLESAVQVQSTPFASLSGQAYGDSSVWSYDTSAVAQATTTTPKQYINPSAPEEREPAAGSQPPPALQRHVIRKATIELKTDDVRAAFLKAAMVLSEARGEYVEGSELTGTGKEAQAHLTLRVAAERLDAVLNQLRQLGEVRAERVEGQDVTAQVVDVEARLRNEQRVEAELLQLLEKRQDAPLREILELRDKIGQIRGEIERLTAQRDQLSRLVSLATVLILIRSGDAPVANGSHLGAYFAQKCKTAWTDGVQFLADTLATLLSILIGGLLWWVVAIVVVVVVYRRWGRKARAA